MPATTKRKFKPSPAKQQEAEAKRAKFRALAKKISEMSQEARETLVNKIGRITTCSPDHPMLSIYNSCMLISQLETVTQVGGFNQWLESGRAVRKGEHGLAIWIPRSMSKDEPTQGEIDKDQPEKPTFFIGYVFDISQTDPIDKPEIAAQREVVRIPEPQPEPAPTMAVLPAGQLAFF